MKVKYREDTGKLLREVDTGDKPYHIGAWGSLCIINNRVYKIDNVTIGGMAYKNVQISVDCVEVIVTKVS